MTPPGPIALRAVADAVANIGVHETSGRPNRGPYIDIYNQAVGAPPGSPWCAAFVYYRLHHAAEALGTTLTNDLYPPMAYTPDIAHWAKDKGLWLPVEAINSNPPAVMRGDLCLLYFRAIGRIGHVGMVAEVQQGAFHSVEGNTHPEGKPGDEREGDGVFLRYRRWTALDLYGGFVRLPF